MARKPSVTVQMTEDPSDLDRLLSAAVNPARPQAVAPTPRNPDPVEKPPPPPLEDEPEDEPPEDEPPEDEPDDDDDPQVAAEDFSRLPEGTVGRTSAAGQPDERPDQPQAVGQEAAAPPKSRKPARKPGQRAPRAPQPRSDRDGGAGPRPPEPTEESIRDRPSGGTGKTFPDNPRPSEDQPPPPQNPAIDTRSRAAKLVEGVQTPADRRYESRITIIDAYQYPGNVAAAPAWVDRNWVAWADEDLTRQIPAGPALRVPTFYTSSGEEVFCRIGDYVARQEVRLLANEPGEIKLEVWAKEQFERIFLPT